MVILKYFIFIIISVVLSGIALWYRQYYISKKKHSLIDSIKLQMPLSIAVCAVYILFAVLTLIYQPVKEISMLNAVQYLLLWDGVFIIAVIDLQFKKIPTSIIILLFIIRMAGIAVNGIIDIENGLIIAVSSLTGMATAAITVFIVLFISKGIGKGDLRLFAVIGLFFGLQGVLSIMIYSIFLSAVPAIFMLILQIFRKAKTKESIPMAPFIFLGLTIYYIFL